MDHNGHQQTSSAQASQTVGPASKLRTDKKSEVRWFLDMLLFFTDRYSEVY